MTSLPLVQTSLSAVKENLPLAVQRLPPFEQAAFTRHSRAVAFKSRNSHTLPADDFARCALMESRVSLGLADRHGAVDQFPTIE